MFLIYNETGKKLELGAWKETKEDSKGTFNVGIAVVEEGKDLQYQTVVTTEDEVYGAILADFGSKHKEITNKTSRFYFKHPEKKVVAYDTRNSKIVTYMKPVDDGSELSKEDYEKSIMPRNCIIFVLDKKSKVVVDEFVIAGRFPSKVINVDDDTKILVFYSRFNNWALTTRQHYIYVDGLKGKKQIEMTFCKTGEQQQFTSNALYEEPFEGETFPVCDNRRQQQRPRYNNRDNDNRGSRPNNRYNNDRNSGGRYNNDRKPYNKDNRNNDRRSNGYSNKERTVMIKNDNGDEVPNYGAYMDGFRKNERDNNGRNYRGRNNHYNKR